MYTTNISPESEIRGSLPLTNPEPEGEGIINSILPITEDKGRMYVCSYTVMAMVHMHDTGVYIL